MKKRILFVDDEPNILDGLRRMLHGRRHEWDMTFVDGGEAALAVLAESPFDVIVSDMRMPRMDGATLLTRVQDEHPEMVRIVLSGYSEMEAALRAVPVAHQFLSKPCDSEVIRGVVERACSLQELLSTESLRATLGNIDTLPSLPRVYNQLTVALVDPDVGLDEVARIVEQDVGITAKILQLVNSSFFGLARRVDGIRHATSILGTRMIRNLVMSAEVFTSFDGRRSPASFSIEAEHVHANRSATLARRLVADRELGEQAHLAAMLHDIGKLILATSEPELFERMAGAARRDERPSFVAEESALGISHAEVGAYLLGIWGMPYPIIEAVANHHHPARVASEGRFDLVGVVHVADALLHELADEAAGVDRPSRLDLRYLESVGVLDELPAWRRIAAETVAATANEAA